MNGLRFAIDIAFKGERPYLQSADIFDAIVGRTGARRNLTLAFKRMLSHPIEAVAAADVADPEACAARFRGEGDNGAFDLVIVEDLDKEVAARVPYDEPRVIADARIEGNAVSSRTGQGASAMERIVALNKHLIHTTVKPGKKLLFSRTSVSELPARDAHLTVRLESRLATRLYRSSIHDAGKPVGEIVFYGV